ncbi:putative membrane protein [Cryobacterium sp. MP_3.1]|uniref:SHOCT domain-containing protein n=1 Tax=Cryobacterium sp. MP_3.1 TaxID=3071711 RepID=UPI002E0847D4|nr:putative membrane protein [Cryobacterium sp. MP_3.1]
MMGNYAGGMGGVGWVLMSLLSVTLIVAIVWMVVGMVTQPRQASATAATPESRIDTPADILKRRLARGEIDTATYEELSSTIDKVR